MTADFKSGLKMDFFCIESDDRKFMRVNRVGIDEGPKDVAFCCVKKKIRVYIKDFVVEHDHLNIKEEDLVNQANEIFMNVNPAIFKRSWINTVLQQDDFKEEGV